MPWTNDQRDEIIEIFRIAYDWRNSHAYPMRGIRQELGGKVRRIQGQGITAARMKRMQSIRKKLSKLTTTFVQIQDIGGCRAILDSMDDVHALVRLYTDGDSAHNLRFNRSYIDAPKLGGYRSHHFVLEFQAREDDTLYHGRRIELQVRTRLQHAWATAVEAVGLVRGEDLKAGEGNTNWLRLFELMSSEFAESEGTPLVPGTPENKAGRTSEIKALDRKLRLAYNLSHICPPTFR